MVYFWAKDFSMQWSLYSVGKPWNESHTRSGGKWSIGYISTSQTSSFNETGKFKFYSSLFKYYDHSYMWGLMSKLLFFMLKFSMVSCCISVSGAPLFSLVHPWYWFALLLQASTYASVSPKTVDNTDGDRMFMMDPRTGEPSFTSLTLNGKNTLDYIFYTGVFSD